MNGTISVVENVFDEFVSLVINKIQAKATGTFVLALSGGSSAQPCYSRLARIPNVDWTQVEVIQVDERCVPLSDEMSNARVITEVFLDLLPVSNQPRFHWMGPEFNPDNYNKLVSDFGQIDFVHLGLGPDGHVASLFPSSPNRNRDDVLIVRNHDETGLNKLERESLTFRAINNARCVAFTVFGKNKADVIAELANGADLPGNQVNGPEVHWLLDKDAASKLPK